MLLCYTQCAGEGCCADELAYEGLKHIQPNAAHASREFNIHSAQHNLIIMFTIGALGEAIDIAMHPNGLFAGELNLTTIHHQQRHILVIAGALHTILKLLYS